MGLACGKTYESPTEFPNTLKIMGICRVAHWQLCNVTYFCTSGRLHWLRATEHIGSDENLLAYGRCRSLARA